MAISFGKNIAALRAANKLTFHTDNVNKSLERLASGSRINRPSDDSADLAVATALKNDIELLKRAKRNANDGVSLLNVTDNALREIGNILNRLDEITTQGLSSYYTFKQRSILQTEALALSSEIQRIAITTNFNNVKLLSATSDVSIQVGIDGSRNSVVNLNAIVGTLESIGLANTGSEALNQTVLGNTMEEAMLLSESFNNAVNFGLDQIAERRGDVGASTSRLESSINTLAAKRENFINSLNQVTDTNVASETANLVSSQIQQQASQAILAQANQVPEIALQLLK